jgi:hypothetical protein
MFSPEFTCFGVWYPHAKGTALLRGFDLTYLGWLLGPVMLFYF